MVHGAPRMEHGRTAEVMRPQDKLLYSHYLEHMAALLIQYRLSWLWH